MLESYSVQARRAVSLATAESRRLGHARVGTEHLLLGLLAEGASETAQTLQAHGANLGAARHKVVEATGAEAADGAPSDPELTPRARRALDRAGRFARQDREPEVRPEHLLLGILDVEGLACQVLRGLGVDLARLREALVPQEAAAAVDVDVEAEGRVADTVRPHCPSCRAALEDTLMAVLMPARHDGDSHATTVRVVYCAGCGAALGAVPAHR